MAIINYYKLKCDYCGARSPELLIGEDAPKIWVQHRIDNLWLNYCCEAHKTLSLGVLSVSEKIEDEW